MSRRKTKRGAVSKDTARPVLIYFPEDVVQVMDDAVRLTDTDRSKFIRHAVRERLARLNLIASTAR